MIKKIRSKLRLHNLKRGNLKIKEMQAWYLYLNQSNHCILLSALMLRDNLFKKLMYCLLIRMETKSKQSRMSLILKRSIRIGRNHKSDKVNRMKKLWIHNKVKLRVHQLVHNLLIHPCNLRIKLRISLE